MLDTITVVLEPGEIKDFNLEEIKGKLEPMDSLKEELNPDVFIGRINNLTVQFKRGKLYITGSIPKAIYQNNLIIPSIDEILCCFDLIKEIFGLPIKLARIVGIDIGYNFEMDHPVQKYLDCLTETPGFTRIRHKNKNSVYYMRSNYTLIFYDKTKEVKRKRYSESTCNLPEGFEDKYVLRYEIRFRSRIDSSFKFGVVRTLLLHSLTFRNELLQRWEKYYFEINKALNLTLEAGIKNLPAFKNQIALNGIGQLGGVKRLVEAVKDYWKEGHIEKKTYDSMRKWIKKISKNDSQFAELDYIKELNEKISRIKSW